MLVDIKEMRLFRKAVYGMKPEWKVQYVYKGDTFVQWIHADDEVGVYAEILRGYADADS